MRHLIAPLAVAAGLGLAAPAPAQTYGIGTMGEGTNSYSTGAAIARLMVEDLSLEARVQPFGGTTDYLPEINSGGVDFGIANVLEAAEAYQGAGPWDGAAQDNLRVVAPVAPLRVAVFVAADSDINSIPDLRGKRVTTQFSRIQSLDLIFDAVLANGGLTLHDLVEVPVPHVVPGADAFLDGQVDAFFFAVVPSKPAQVHATIPLKILPFDTSEEAVGRMTEIFPYGRIGTAAPIPPLPFVTEPTPILEYDNLLVTGAHVPDDVVQSVADGLVAGKEDLAAAYAPLAAFNPDRIGQGDLGTPYHDGIVAWASSM